MLLTLHGVFQGVISNAFDEVFNLLMIVERVLSLQVEERISLASQDASQSPCQSSLFPETICCGPEALVGFTEPLEGLSVG